MKMKNIKWLLAERAYKLCRYSAIFGMNQEQLFDKFKSMNQECAICNCSLIGETLFSTYCRNELSKYLFNCLAIGKKPSQIANLFYSSLQDYESCLEFSKFHKEPKKEIRKENENE